MALKHITTVWLIRDGVHLAWAMAQAARKLGDAGERLETRLEAVAKVWGVDLLDVLEPLVAPLSKG